MMPKKKLSEKEQKKLVSSRYAVMYLPNTSWDFYDAYNRSEPVEAATIDLELSTKGKNLDKYLQKQYDEHMRQLQFKNRKVGPELPPCVVELLELQKPNGKFDQIGPVLACFGVPDDVPSKLSRGSRYTEWEIATSFAVAAMRQQNHMFDKLGDKHDAAFQWLQMSELVSEARELLHEYQFTVPGSSPMGSLHNKAAASRKSSIQSNVPANIVGAPSTENGVYDSGAVGTARDGGAGYSTEWKDVPVAEVQPDDDVDKDQHDPTISTDAKLTADSKALVDQNNPNRAGIGFGVKSVTISEHKTVLSPIKDDAFDFNYHDVHESKEGTATTTTAAAASAAGFEYDDSEDFVPRPGSPLSAASRTSSFMALQAKLNELTATRDEEKIAAQQDIVDTIQMEVIDIYLNIEKRLQAVIDCMHQCIGSYIASETIKVRHKQFEELTFRLGDGKPPQGGFDDWRQEGCPGMRPLMIDFFTTVQRMAEERLLLQELEHPEGRALGAKVDIAVNLSKWKLMWHGQDLVLKVIHSMDFLRKCRELSEWYGPSFFFRGNPLMLPLPMSKIYERLEDFDPQVHDQRYSVPHARLGIMNLAEKGEWLHEQNLNKFRRNFQTMEEDWAFNWPELSDVRDTTMNTRMHTALLVMYVTYQEDLQATNADEKLFISKISSIRAQDKLLIGTNTAKVDRKLNLPSPSERKERPPNLIKAANRMNNPRYSVVQPTMGMAAGMGRFGSISGGTKPFGGQGLRGVFKKSLYGLRLTNGMKGAAAGAETGAGAGGGAMRTSSVDKKVRAEFSTTSGVESSSYVTVSDTSKEKVDINVMRPQMQRAKIFTDIIRHAEEANAAVHAAQEDEDEFQQLQREFELKHQQPLQEQLGEGQRQPPAVGGGGGGGGGGGEGGNNSDDEKDELDSVGLAIAAAAKESHTGDTLETGNIKPPIQEEKGEEAANQAAGAEARAAGEGLASRSTAVRRFVEAAGSSGAAGGGAGRGRGRGRHALVPVARAGKASVAATGGGKRQSISAGSPSAVNPAASTANSGTNTTAAVAAASESAMMGRRKHRPSIASRKASTLSAALPDSVGGGSGLLRTTSSKGTLSPAKSSKRMSVISTASSVRPARDGGGGGGGEGNTTAASILANPNSPSSTPVQGARRPTVSHHVTATLGDVGRKSRSPSKLVPSPAVSESRKRSHRPSVLTAAPSGISKSSSPPSPQPLIAGLGNAGDGSEAGGAGGGEAGGVVDMQRIARAASRHKARKGSTITATATATVKAAGSDSIEKGSKSKRKSSNRGGDRKHSEAIGAPNAHNQPSEIPRIPTAPSERASPAAGVAAPGRNRAGSIQSAAGSTDLNMVSPSDAALMKPYPILKTSSNLSGGMGGGVAAGGVGSGGNQTPTASSTKRLQFAPSADGTTSAAGGGIGGYGVRNKRRTISFDDDFDFDDYGAEDDDALIAGVGRAAVAATPTTPFNASFGRQDSSFSLQSDGPSLKSFHLSPPYVPPGAAGFDGLDSSSPTGATTVGRGGGSGGGGSGSGAFDLAASSAAAAAAAAVAVAGGGGGGGGRRRSDESVSSSGKDKVTRLPAVMSKQPSQTLTRRKGSVDSIGSMGGSSAGRRSRSTQGSY